MKQASRDTRERAVAAWKNGISIRQICESYKICRKTFYSWRKRDSEGGEQVPLPKGRPPNILTEKDKHNIQKLLSENKSLFAWEIIKILELNCSVTTIYRVLKQLGQTLKKKEFIASERNKEEVQIERINWGIYLRTANFYRLAFLDETGIKTNYVSNYGWSKRGEPCIDHRPCGWKSYSLISTITLDGIVTSWTIEGAFNKEYFKEYMEKQLLPLLKRGYTVIMDNLPVHKNSFDIAKFLRKGILIKYLPRYSPDLNPIEFMWSKVKAILRQIGARTQDELWHATNEALWSITTDNIAGWFKKCGYLHV